MENEKVLKTGISKDVYIENDSTDILHQFNSIEEIDKSFNEKEIPVSYTLEISEDDENITIEPKILKTGQVNYDKNEYKPVYKGNIYVKKNEKTNEPEIYADTEYISEEISDNITDDNLGKIINLIFGIPIDAGLSQIDNIKKYKNLSIFKKFSVLSSLSGFIKVPIYIYNVFDNIGENGLKKTIFTTTATTLTLIFIESVVSILVGAAFVSYALPIAIILSFVSASASDNIENFFDNKYDNLRIIYQKKNKKLKIETNDFKNFDNLINYLKQDKFKDIFSDIAIENITNKREKQGEKIAKCIFENKTSLLSEEDKNFKYITGIYKQSNKITNSQKQQKEIVKICKKADDMLIERLKAKLGDDIKISIDYSNCPDIISEYI